jgi:hypothetical protein
MTVPLILNIHPPLALMIQPCKRIFSQISILLILFTLLGLPQLTGSAASAHFYYFNPDSSHSNLAGLKQSMDTFLTAGGFGFEFQPFTRFRDFDRQVKATQPSFLFLPGWYLKQDGNAKRFKPFMIPVHGGVTTYRKVLLVAADSAMTIKDLIGPTIAMTPVGPAGMTMLNDVIFTENGLDGNQLNFITTSKDADALFALALGQVKAALISEDNLKYIGSINARILKNVKPLAVSKPIPLPVLCYAEGTVTAAEIDKFRQSLLAGKQDKNTAHIMELLQIDAWQSPNP